MTKTLIDIDDNVLKRAIELSGLPTKKAVVASALESYVRRMEVALYADFATSGVFVELGDESVIVDAQR